MNLQDKIVLVTGGSGGIGSEVAKAFVNEGAKAGLQKFSENLALMLAPKVRVVSIAPGYTATHMWDSFSEEEKQKCIEAMPIKRFVAPEEVSDFIVSLAKNEAITGGNFTIDGGLNLKNLI